MHDYTTNRYYKRQTDRDRERQRQTDRQTDNRRQREVWGRERTDRQTDRQRQRLLQKHFRQRAQCGSRLYVSGVVVTKTAVLIDDSTPVSQSRHTLRFQPIACRSIVRCPRVLTRPEIVWQAFVPDIASGPLAVFDMAEEKNPGKRNYCYGQCKSDERYPDKCAGVTF